MTYRRNLTPVALLALLWLSACATRSPPVLQPVAVQCRKLQVDPSLLLPAERSSMTRLQLLLGMPSPSVPGTQTGLMR